MRDEGHGFIFLSLCGMDNGKLFSDRDEKRPISISALFSIANAAKGKQRNSHAPHLYLAKAIGTDAAKGKKEKARLPISILQKQSAPTPQNVRTKKSRLLFPLPSFLRPTSLRGRGIFVKRGYLLFAMWYNIAYEIILF